MTTPEHLLRELGITSPNEIDVEVIAWHCGLEVQYKELRSCDARIVGAGDRGVLSVDVNRSPERKRFSVAHEIGHWQLHRGQIMMCRADEIDVGKKSNSAHERDADAFAAALLMPAICSSRPQLWCLRRSRGRRLPNLARSSRQASWQPPFD